MRKLFILLFFVFVSSLFAQVKDYQLGSTTMGNYRQQGGYFDYSEPNSVNIEVNIWGWVKYPGKYLIPDGSNTMDLLSYAGGPLDEANLYDLRIYRQVFDTVGTKIDTSHIFLTFDYEDLLWSENLTKSGKNIPELMPGDNLSVPGEPKIYDKDWISIALSITSVLISLATLIVTLSK